QIQAAINAVHSVASNVAETDWASVLDLYDQLLAVAPSPVVALNRAVALAEAEGPEAGLAATEGLDLDGYHLYHATRASLLERLGRVDEARAAYESARATVGNDPERTFLEARIAGLASWG
ncbi:MAG TPA: tetratricopeptide repeat protein, partial [Acidimicrobiales bacterium]|nr:tetratricopeptide repeat protein [Acidimicrobiales bacterium]